jgi:hypothetical protein
VAVERQSAARLMNAVDGTRVSLNHSWRCSMIDMRQRKQRKGW